METRKRIDLQAGVKYKGYGLVNAFGEFEFIPEQTGSRQGRRRLLTEGENFTLSETSQMLILHLSLSKEHKGLKLITQLLKIIDSIIIYLKNHEI